MIVKLQRPITPSDAPVMLYDQYRKHMALLPMSEVEMDALFGAALRVYHEAELIDGEWRIGKRVPDRGW